MNLQIIRQPDGKLGIWSSNVNHFLFLGAEREAVIEYFVKEAATQERERIIKRLDNLEEEEKTKSIPHWRMNFKDALEIIEREHSKEERDNVWNFIGKLKRVKE